MRSGHAAPPISYTSPPAREILEEDKLIESYKLNLDPKRVEVVPVEQGFQQLSVASCQLGFLLTTGNLFLYLLLASTFDIISFTSFLRVRFFKAVAYDYYISLNVV